MGSFLKKCLEWRAMPVVKRLASPRMCWLPFLTWTKMR
jgi:hypothetical protein